jgi:hypothetical protein
MRRRSTWIQAERRRADGHGEPHLCAITPSTSPSEAPIVGSGDMEQSDLHASAYAVGNGGRDVLRPVRSATGSAAGVQCAIPDANVILPTVGLTPRTFPALSATGKEWDSVEVRVSAAAPRSRATSGCARDTPWRHPCVTACASWSAPRPASRRARRGAAVFYFFGTRRPGFPVEVGQGDCYGRLLPEVFVRLARTRANGYATCRSRCASQHGASR